MALRKGETLEPDSASLAFQLGWCLENLDRPDEAELLYSRALRLDPGMIEAYNGLGWLFYGREQYDVALVLFEKALELDAENPEWADHVGWTHLLLKQPGQINLSTLHHKQQMPLATSRTGLDLAVDETNDTTIAFQPLQQRDFVHVSAHRLGVGLVEGDALDSVQFILVVQNAEDAR